MKRTLPLNQAIGPGLVQIGTRLIIDAIGWLDALPKDPHHAVHHARVDLKRARSVLRLLEKAGARWARTLRRRLSGQARLLATARDAAAAAELAGELARLPQPERGLLIRSSRRPSLRLGMPVAAIRAALWTEVAAISVHTPPPVSVRDLQALVRRSLRRAARNQRRVARHPELERLHEWRKAVVVLRDQTGLASKRWPEGAGDAHPRLVRFARRLGHVRDLALLSTSIRRRKLEGARVACERLARRLDRMQGQELERVVRSWPRLEKSLARALGEQ